MSALTSLLVRDRVVPVKKIEEAIQRQVISGGALDRRGAFSTQWLHLTDEARRREILTATN